MRTEKASRPNAADDKARRFAVAGFVASLKHRLRDTLAETALPERLEAVARQVERRVAAGASSADERLAERFTQAATSIGARVHPATIADWLDVVAGLLPALRIGCVAIPRAGDGFFEAEQVEQLKQRLAADGITARSETDDETLFSAEAAITGVVAAVAETGTLVCESQPTVARGSSLIPPVHIAVVTHSQLLPDLCDCFDALSERSELPANVSLISGPSKTADIEGVLVTGVHGPGDVQVVLVREG
ncbi:MAG: lactate utilization protein C [Phycisphaerae bacterium]